MITTSDENKFLIFLCIVACIPIIFFGLPEMINLIMSKKVINEEFIHTYAEVIETKHDSTKEGSRCYEDKYGNLHHIAKYDAGCHYVYIKYGNDTYRYNNVYVYEKCYNTDEIPITILQKTYDDGSIDNEIVEICEIPQSYIGDYMRKGR